MIILSIFSQRSRNIWMTRTVDFWKTCSRGHRTCRRTAGNPEKRSERKIGANLSLSYRFAPDLYRYEISTVYVPFRLMSVQELTQYDMIAFCGGNAHTLLSEINRTGFSKPLKQAIENGLVYLGISAGSMIAAGNFSDGLGYLANPLIPHAEKESPFGDISKNDLIELADGQTVLIKGIDRKLFNKLNTVVFLSSGHPDPNFQN